MTITSKISDVKYSSKIPTAASEIWTVGPKKDEKGGMCTGVRSSDHSVGRALALSSLPSISTIP